jgi:hypothetical protein
MSVLSNEALARNILLNVFDSYDDLQGSHLEELLMGGTPNEEPLKDYRNFVGKMVMSVPEYDAATGTWSEEHKFKLKIEKNQGSA